MKISEHVSAQFKNYIDHYVTIPDDAWHAFLPLIRPVELEKGDYFITGRESVIKIGYLVSGLLQTFFITESGDEFTTDFCFDNMITTNYDILMPGSSHGYQSRALEPTLILQVDYDRFRKLCETYSVWDDFKKTLIEYYYSQKVTREKELLSLTADRKYLKFIEKYRPILDRLQQYHIASYLGITPVALSRIKKNLNKNT